jgi:hypothetical protein
MLLLPFSSILRYKSSPPDLIHFLAAQICSYSIISPSPLCTIGTICLNSCLPVFLHKEKSLLPLLVLPLPHLVSFVEKSSANSRLELSREPQVSRCSFIVFIIAACVNSAIRDWSHLFIFIRFATRHYRPQTLGNPGTKRST